MKRMLGCILVLIVGLSTGCVGTKTGSDVENSIHETEIRVPAEWEPHAATWMQWPTKWEAELRPVFAEIIDVIQIYEPVHLLTSNESEKAEAEKFLTEQGTPDTNITWHIIPVDNAWMRDNGPVYVTDGTSIWIQNWKFDAWGGNFGRDVPFKNDDLVPDRVADYLASSGRIVKTPY